MRIRILNDKPADLEPSTIRLAWKQSFGKTLGDCSTAEALLAGWMHLFLWGMSNSDRALMLSAALGKEVKPEEVAPVPKTYGLKSWEDFPDAYPQAPIRIETKE